MITMLLFLVFLAHFASLFLMAHLVTVWTMWRKNHGHRFPRTAIGVLLLLIPFGLLLGLHIYGLIQGFFQQTVMYATVAVLGFMTLLYVCTMALEWYTMIRSSAVVTKWFVASSARPTCPSPASGPPTYIQGDQHRAFHPFGVSSFCRGKKFADSIRTDNALKPVKSHHTSVLFLSIGSMAQLAERSAVNREWHRSLAARQAAAQAGGSRTPLLPAPPGSPQPSDLSPAPRGDLTRQLAAFLRWEHTRDDLGRGGDPGTSAIDGSPTAAGLRLPTSLLSPSPTSPRHRGHHHPHGPHHPGITPGLTYGTEAISPSGGGQTVSPSGGDDGDHDDDDKDGGGRWNIARWIGRMLRQGFVPPPPPSDEALFGRPFRAGCGADAAVAAHGNLPTQLMHILGLHPSFRLKLGSLQLLLGLFGLAVFGYVGVWSSFYFFLGYALLTLCMVIFAGAVLWRSRRDERDERTAARLYQRALQSDGTRVGSGLTSPDMVLFPEVTRVPPPWPIRRARRRVTAHLTHIYLWTTLGFLAAHGILLQVFSWQVGWPMGVAGLVFIFGTSGLFFDHRRRFALSPGLLSFFLALFFVFAIVVLGFGSAIKESGDPFHLAPQGSYNESVVQWCLTDEEGGPIAPSRPAGLPPYQGCHQTWAGPHHPLSLLDLGILSRLAYGNATTLATAVPTLLPGTDYRLEGHSCKQQGVCFYEVYSPEDNTSVVVVRGTQSAFDIVQDVDIWGEATIFELGAMGPVVSAWPPSMTSDLVHIVSAVNAYFSFPYAYHRALQQYVEALSDRRAQVLLTGHSLGGGVASIVGVATHHLTVAFSAPGILYLSGKLHLNPLRLHQYLFDVVPDLDLVPRIGAFAGTVQHIDCTAGYLACHQLMRSLCEISRACGDPLGRRLVPGKHS
ncbi:putative Lipase; class 3 [Paratrimastix pyriformis]|uniref:Lipase n=1 Tax=Paratrimastix pyriformis TaxID=342808 RepID=A0ABQ8UQC0_9EUKA|nr:putative Lipase; class 3 [Paratrimastix pyriformis]